MANQVYNSWNTCVKLVWSLPRATHNYFVEHLLAKDFRSARQQILSQYIGFLKRLRRSVSSEVRILTNIIAKDVRSVTGKNCHNISREFALNPWEVSSSYFCNIYKYYPMPDQARWRLSFLMDLLKNKYEMLACDEEINILNGLIESLCSS